MKKYILTIFLTMAICSPVLWAQERHLSYTGALPTPYLQPAERDCLWPEEMSEAEAEQYLRQHLTISNPSDCGALHYECTYGEIWREDECRHEFYRYFTVWNDCGESFQVWQIVYSLKYDPQGFGLNLAPEEIDGFDILDADFSGYEGNRYIYLVSHGVEFPECWPNPKISFDYTEVAGGESGCSKEYDVTFTCSPGDLCPQSFEVHQHITVSSSQGISASSNELDELTILNGCDINSLPPAYTYYFDFAVDGVIIENVFNPDKITITNEDFVEDESGNPRKYRRVYHVTDECSGSTIDLQQSFNVYNDIKAVTSWLTAKNENYDIKEINDEVHLTTGCGLSDLYIIDIEDNSIAGADPSEFLRRDYRIGSTKWEDLEHSISQIVRQRNEEPSLFELDFTTDVSVMGANDGYARIKKANGYAKCPGGENAPEKAFKIEWHNHTSDEYFVTDPEAFYFNDIYEIDTLTAGNYTVKIFPICSDCDWDTEKPVFVGGFTIGEKKIAVDIVTDRSLLSDHYYQSLDHVINVVDEEGEYNPVAHYQNNRSDDNPLSGLEDEWEEGEGYIFSPKKKSFDPYEMYNPYMNGNGFYEDFIWRYEMLNETFNSTDLQRIILTKDNKRRTTYRVYRKGENRSERRLLAEATKTFYSEELWCANDPNEIYGPAGFGEHKMISNQDPSTIRYTIMFENDPEMATAAAARVKVSCPLSDKVDPTTFRIGNFGFNNMTFEVPELSSYYNERFLMDSLGYWLDVTASVLVPENEAYWIFQTIDPETGVAPINSLGFLPINDTLTGCGEGWVTFTVKLADDIITGDSIVENAQILFDENDIVPTNDYCNYFDVAPPVSYLRCDTIGAAYTRNLPIHLYASDDYGGSGVHHINLFCSIDGQDYQLAYSSQPDSIIDFYIKEGSLLQFFTQAVDNVGNAEPIKTVPELVYTYGNPPKNLSLSNHTFYEDVKQSFEIGTFSTIDDQTTDDFIYEFVLGSGSTDNDKFRIDGNKLLTNFDFRCYGLYDYSIRVRTTDLTGLSIEMPFTLHAYRTNEIKPTYMYETLCPGDTIIFGNQHIYEDGDYEHTFSSKYGCDSLVYLIITSAPAPTTTMAYDFICSNDAYFDNGFDLSENDIASLTHGWTRIADTIVMVDRYVTNPYGCIDTTRLELTITPAYDILDEYYVCYDELPFEYKYRLFETDTTIIFRYHTAQGCDSITTFSLSINNQSGTQEDLLNGEWNWYSTYIDMNGNHGMDKLKNALGYDGEIIKSQTQFDYFNNGSWFGSLNRIDNESMYMIKTRQPHSVVLTGCYADVQASPISLHNGWNWIGYPLAYSMSVATAMAGLSGSPSDGDIIKSHSSFAYFNAQFNNWFGSLSMLSPGCGYMYQSNSNSDLTLNYPDIRRNMGQDIPMPETFWKPDVHHFANNMNFVGIIELDNNRIESDTLEIGVFCQDSQRGSGRAIYLEGPNTYRIFLTVHGENGDTLQFSLFDHEKNKMRRCSSLQRLVFQADEVKGSLEHPYPFVFNTDYDKRIEAEICDGQFYDRNGFHVCESGTYFNELPNDSIIRLDLTVNPVYRETLDLIAVEFPFHYNDLTFDSPGSYEMTFPTVNSCDSTLVITVTPYDGLRKLLISPVPADPDQRVKLFFPFTESEQNDLLVEVYTVGGNLVQTLKPHHYPIELLPIATSGTYLVRITMGTNEIITGKFVVK